MIDRLEQARDVVRRHRVPESLRRLSKKDDGLSYYDGGGTSFLRSRVTSDVLARCLHYMIKLKLRGIRDEFEVPLGLSKYKGLPHLPRGFTWPNGRYFLAQFNLAELHSLDLHRAFPASGMFYIFFSPAGEVTVSHYDGPVDQLQIVPYPDSTKKFSGAKYYLEGFKSLSSVITFRPKAIFYLGGDAYNLSTVKRLVHKDLRNQVAAILGGPVVSRDTDCRIFGRPMYWQGEDERLDESDDSHESRHLLFQDEFGEGHIHVWIDAADARRQDYSKCWIDYSGT